MEPRSVLILRSAPPAPEFSYFRQENNFYYLTGLNESNSALIIKSPRTMQDKGDIILFIAPRSENTDWNPPTLGLEGAKERLGFQNVRSFSEFQTEFEQTLLNKPSVLYFTYERSQGINTSLTPDESFIKQLMEKKIQFSIKSPDLLIAPMRRIKSPAEINNLQKAADITAEALKEAMRSLQGDLIEYQLQSIIEHVFSFNGARRPGFTSIIGSGPNSVVLHWNQNSRTMRTGELVVVNVGAEYNMYTADITRTLPVSGKFSNRQKQIYEIVLSVHDSIAPKLKPGVPFREIASIANNILATGLQKIGLINNPQDIGKYFFHGLGHHIGLYVNDVGVLDTLKAGMVLAIEPGIYIRDEWLGVRIEDDYLITETGYVRLSKNVPRTISEIEAMMSEKGMDYSRYFIIKK